MISTTVWSRFSERRNCVCFATFAHIGGSRRLADHGFVSLYLPVLLTGGIAEETTADNRFHEPRDVFHQK